MVESVKLVTNSFHGRMKIQRHESHDDDVFRTKPAFIWLKRNFKPKITPITEAYGRAWRSEVHFRMCNVLLCLVKTWRTTLKCLIVAINEFGSGWNTEKSEK